MNGKRKNSGSDRYFSNLTLGHAEPIAVFCRFVKHVVQGEKQEKEIVFL